VAGEREFRDFPYTVYQYLKTPETVTQGIDPDLTVKAGFMEMV
jgi:hypothetical protein